MNLDPARLPRNLEQQKYYTFNTASGVIGFLLFVVSIGLLWGYVFLFHDRLLDNAWLWVVAPIVVVAWVALGVIHVRRKRRFIEIARDQGISEKQAKALWDYSEPGTD